MPAPVAPLTAGSGRRRWWQYLYGPHIWIESAEANFAKGMVRDAPRSAIPAGAVYDSADFLLHQPGLAMKRGGTAYAGPALGANNSVNTVAFAAFPAGSKIVAIGGGNGHMYTVTAGATTDLTGAIMTTLDTPKLRVGGGKNLLIFSDATGTAAPTKYDGSAAPSTLGGTPAAGKFCEIYKTRLALANTTTAPNRIQFSPTPDIESTWDTATAWIDTDYAITGMAAMSNALLIFSAGITERITGSSPPPGSDMTLTPIGSVGCTDARSIVKQEGNVIFANTRGVYLTNGAGFASLTTEGLIETYWQSLFVGYDPTTWIISAGVFRGFYIVSVINAAGTNVTTLMCNVPRKAWWRLTNVNATMWGQALGAQDELYYSDRNSGRVVGISGMFTPSAANKNDANGTAVTPYLETRMLGTGLSLKSFGFGHLNYDMRDAATDNPTMAVSTAVGTEATTYVSPVESPLAKTTDMLRSRFTISNVSQGVSCKFQQTNASSKTEIYALEYESRGFPVTAEGQ
jgi:hypothetical protein